jgi:hypothetical protein
MKILICTCLFPSFLSGTLSNKHEKCPVENVSNILWQLPEFDAEQKELIQPGV